MLHHLNKSYIYSIVISLLICSIFYALNRKNDERNKISLKTMIKLLLSSFVASMGGFYLLRYVSNKSSVNTPVVNTSVNTPPVSLEQTIMTGNPRF